MLLMRIFGKTTSILSNGIQRIFKLNVYGPVYGHVMERLNWSVKLTWLVVSSWRQTRDSKKLRKDSQIALSRF
jgi:hypothetical protein